MDVLNRVTFKVSAPVLPPPEYVVIEGTRYAVDLMMFGGKKPRGVLTFIEILDEPFSLKDSVSYLPGPRGRKQLVIEGPIIKGKFVEKEREWSVLDDR